MRRLGRTVHVSLVTSSQCTPCRSAASTPLGGYDDESLPPAPHTFSKAQRSQNRLSSVRIGKELGPREKNLKRANKRKLDPSLVSTYSMKQALNMNQLSSRQPVSHHPDIDEMMSPTAATSVHTLADTTTTATDRPRADLISVSLEEASEEYAPTNRFRSTVFSDELDAVERDFNQNRSGVQSRKLAFFRSDEVYQNAASIMSDNGDEGNSRVGTSSDQRGHLRDGVRRAGCVVQYSKKQLLRGVKLPPREIATSHDTGITPGAADDAAPDDMPANSNPHFPTEEESSSNQRAKAQRPGNKSRVPILEPDSYDAYVTRAHDHTLVSERGTEFWDDPANRQRVEDLARAHEEDVTLDYLKESPVDNVPANYHAELVRKESLLFVRAHPLNEMIQDHFVRITSIKPSDGSDDILIDRDDQRDVTLGEARALAREHGLDLVRVGETWSPSHSTKTIVGICVLANHRQMMREMTKHKLLVKGGIQPPRPAECVEVPFRGGTHPHAIRFKAIGIAKLLIRQTPVRVNLKDFGTAREGFPIFQIVLDEIKKQCVPIKAFHRAGPIQSNYDEIFCFLHPSTARNPKFDVRHPSSPVIEHARNQRIMEEEKETLFDGYYDQKSVRDRLRYATQIDKGVAWSTRDEGLTLQRQRDIKVMLGYLPKGNKEMYAARGDVDVSHPFRANHATSTERWSYPAESNLDQSSRAAAVLGNRMSMDISDMHARGETEGNPSVIERFYYRVQGPALEVGEFKEALGLKSNRKKTPGLAPGWATLGRKSGPEEDRHTAAK